MIDNNLKNCDFVRIDVGFRNKEYFGDFVRLNFEGDVS